MLARSSALAALLSKAHPAEGETIVRLLTGGLRAGSGEGLFEDALAKAFDVPIKAIRYAAMLNGDLGETAVAARNNQLEAISLKPGTGLKPMLASPSKDAGEVMAWHDSKETCSGWNRSMTASGPNFISPVGRRLLFATSARSTMSSPKSLRRPGNCLLCSDELIAYAEGKRLTFFDFKNMGRKRLRVTSLGSAIQLIHCL